MRRLELLLSWNGEGTCKREVWATKRAWMQGFYYLGNALGSLPISQLSVCIRVRAKGDIMELQLTPGWKGK